MSPQEAEYSLNSVARMCFNRILKKERKTLDIFENCVINNINEVH